MSAYNVDIPNSKWTMLEWRNPNYDKPSEGNRVLVVSGGDIHPARFVNGAFFLGDWTRASVVSLWSPWPKPPLA